MTRDKEDQSRAMSVQELIRSIDYLLPEVNQINPEAARRLSEANELLQQALIRNPDNKSKD